MAVRESINPALNKGIFRATTGSSVIDNTPRNVHHLAKLDRWVVQQPTTRSAEMGENQRPRPYGLVTRVHCPADPELSGRSGRHEKARVIKDAGLCYSRDQDPIPAPLLYQGNGAPPESEMNSRLLPRNRKPNYPRNQPRRATRPCRRGKSDPARALRQPPRLRLHRGPPAPHQRPPC